MDSKSLLHYSNLKTTATFFLVKSSTIRIHASGISSSSSSVSFRTDKLFSMKKGRLHDSQFRYGKIPSNGIVMVCLAPQYGHDRILCFFRSVAVSDFTSIFLSSSSQEEYIRCSGEFPLDHNSLKMLRASFRSYCLHSGQSF